MVGLNPLTKEFIVGSLQEARYFMGGVHFRSVLGVNRSGAYLFLIEHLMNIK